MFKPGRKICEHIVEEGFTRIILCVPFIPVWEKKFYYVNNRLFYLFTLLFAGSVFKKADVVHASDGNLGIFASWLKKKYSFKLLVQFIGGDLNQDLPRVYKKSWMRNWKKGLDAVSFNSLTLGKRFVELFGEHPKTRLIYRGVDTSFFTPAKEKLPPVVFYFLGGLPDYSTFTHGRNTKGGMNLMKAWSKLDTEIKGENIRLLFAGPDSDISMVKEWQSALQEPARVKVLGKIDPAGIPGFHKSGNVALIPSLEEGLPNVAMEAAATGNLVIANAVGGIPEVICNGINGILCDTNDAEGLYAKMKWVIEHPDQIATMGKKAVENIQMNFSSKDFGKKYVEFYQEMISK